jgi:hypothetical protein
MSMGTGSLNQASGPVTIIKWRRLAQSRFPIPLLLVYINASEVDNYQNGVVIILGLADRPKALVDEFSGSRADGC